MEGSAFKASYGLKKTLLEASSDTHGLTGSFHLGSETRIGISEFIEWEPGHLGHYVIKSRLEACRSVGKLYLFKVISDAYLGRDSGDRISGCLGGKSGGPGDSGINLNQIVFKGFRVKCKLNIASSAYLKGADELESRVTEHVILFVGKGLGRTYDYGVTGMYSDGIQILHVTYSDRSVTCITDHFIFDLLVSPDALFNQNLMNGRKLKSCFQKGDQLILIIGKAAACSSESKSGTEYNGISYLLCSLFAFIQTVYNDGRKNGLSDPFTELLELLSVLSHLYTGGIRSQKLASALCKDSLLFQLHRKVETGLSADTGKDGIRSFGPYYPRHIFEIKRLHIYSVRNRLVRHYGRGVGVTEDDLIALFL